MMLNKEIYNDINFNKKEKSEYVNSPCSRDDLDQILHSQTIQGSRGSAVSRASTQEQDHLFYSKNFEYIAQEWLNLIRPQLKDSSLAKYRNILNIYLLPKYSGRQIDKITRRDIAEYCLRADGTLGQAEAASIPLRPQQD